MATLIVKHSVSDYAKWKPVFDQHAGTRKAAGCEGGTLFRDAQKPNDVTIVFRWNSVENAQKFIASSDLKSTMEKAGVLGQPQASFLNDAGQFSS